RHVADAVWQSPASPGNRRPARRLIPAQRPPPARGISRDGADALEPHLPGTCRLNRVFSHKHSIGIPRSFSEQSAVRPKLGRQVRFHTIESSEAETRRFWTGVEVHT